MSSKLITIMALTLLTTSCIGTDGIKDQKQVIDAMANTLKKQYSQNENIDCKELALRKSQKDNRLVIIDARDDFQFDVSHIGGSVPIRDMQLAFPELSGKEVVIYSTIGTRSNKAINSLKPIYTNTNFKNLSGGILNWLQCGYKIYNQGKETKDIRFVNDAWIIVPKGYNGFVK